MESFYLKDALVAVFLNYLKLFLCSKTKNKKPVLKLQIYKFFEKGNLVSILGMTDSRSSNLTSGTCVFWNLNLTSPFIGFTLKKADRLSCSNLARWSLYLQISGLLAALSQIEISFLSPNCRKYFEIGFHWATCIPLNHKDKIGYLWKRKWECLQ